MDSPDTTVLFIGYGNPGRLDDGLGPALADALEKLDLPGVSVDADYQLMIEDAAVAAEHDFVIFADAAVKGGDTYFFHAIEPRDPSGFSTHSVEPEAVLGMAHKMFGASTKGFVLGIRGYEFNEFGERLSVGAQANLRRALEFIEPVLRERSFDQAADRQTVKKTI